MTVDESRLVRMAETARRPTRWWLAWVVVLVVIIVVRPLGFSLGNAVLDDPGRTQPMYPYVDAFSALAVLLALVLWVRAKEGRRFATVGFRPGRHWVRVFAGFGVGGALAAVGVAAGMLTGLYAEGQSTHTRTGLDAVLTLLPLVLLALLVGAGQEALTRGYLLQMSVRQLPAWVAIVSTSALVTVLHSLSPISMVNALLYALFASLVALQQGSLWAVAGIQAGWSFTQINILGLPVGGIPDASALWSIGPVPGSSTDLSGGIFGFDAGLLATAILAAATVAAYLRLRRSAMVTPEPAEAGTTPLTAPVPTPTPTPMKETAHVAH